MNAPRWEAANERGKGWAVRPVHPDGAGYGAFATGLTESDALMIAASPVMLAALELAAELIESGIEAIWGDDEPDPDCRHISGLATIRAAIASAKGAA